MREKTIENSIKRYLKKIGAYYVKYHGGTYSTTGIPDLLVCYKGKFIGIEVKNSKGRTSILQEANLKLISQSGGISIVARTIDDVKRIFNEI